MINKRKHELLRELSESTLEFIKNFQIDPNLNKNVDKELSERMELYKELDNDLSVLELLSKFIKIEMVHFNGKSVLLIRADNSEAEKNQEALLFINECLKGMK